MCPFTLAGLWENWKDPDTGEWVRTFTIITTDANELVAELHDRMPVIIAPEDRERWLKGPNPEELLKPYPAEHMTMWAVSPKLNSPKNDSPDLLEPVEEPDAAAHGNVVSANEGEPERADELRLSLITSPSPCVAAGRLVIPIPPPRESRLTGSRSIYSGITLPL